MGGSRVVSSSADANGGAHDDNVDEDDDSFDELDGGGMLWDRSIGPKVDRARLLRGVLEGGVRWKIGVRETGDELVVERGGCDAVSY